MITQPSALLSFDAESARRGFRFDPEPHHYWLDQKRIPSVSEILEATGFKGRAKNATHQENIDRAGRRGTRVHLFTHWLDENDLDWSDVKDDEIPYVTGWEGFRQEHDFKPYLHETPMWDPDLLYGVTPDCFGTWHGGKPVIVEKKTGDHLYWHRFQTMFQKMTIRKWWPADYERVVVRLTSWGSALPREYKDDAIDSMICRAAVTCFQSQQTMGGLHGID
ncbi:MAG: hypothetical protein DMF62_02385 [Acidobacteria bacterium]|nr:MAG: hypothetical protein DMF62_02385 [Acidobacteriota bacterium]